MQPEGPYRFTHALGGSPVGKAWAAIDGQGRFVTVAVLDAAVAAAPGWRDAFAGIANSLAQAPDGMPYTYADFSADAPWVAYPAEAGPGAEKLFRALGVEYTPVPTTVHPTSAPPVSAPPESGPPRPTSGMPYAPWAVQATPVSGQPAAPHPVSGAPASPAPPEARAAAYAQSQTSPPTAAADVPPADPFASPVRRITPSAPPPRRTGLWAGVAALFLVAALAGGATVWTLSGDDDPPPPVPTAAPTGAPVAGPGPALKPWAEAALYSSEERALAVAAPSLVFLEAVFTGYVRDARTGTPVRTAPITFTRRCTGFVVNPEGHALTSGSCVKPSAETMRQIALDAVARMLVREKTLAAGDVESYVRANLSKVRFTGIDPGTEPAVEAFGQLNHAKGNVTTEPAIPVQVVRTQAPEAGNVALVKLARNGLPAVELNPSPSLSDGGAVRLIGFATDDTDFRTAGYDPRSKVVTITGTGRRGPVSIYRTNEDVGATSHGGIALDPSGRVAGLIDQDQARPDRANRVIVPASTAADLLAEAGVGNNLGDVDKLYRSGLDAYFAGQHTEAITQLEQTAQQSPANLLAQAYRQNAIERQQHEADPATGPDWLMVVFGGVGGALLVGLVVLVVVLIRGRATR